ncbi:glycosyltransferase family 39 protein [Pseudorhodoferax sp.]|uniref:glycosyltransferase family 39 protein n=1 Tax=Pseudorhodoferax sp. TaxID=1993553 RepID=UPI0039E3F1A0
MSAHPPALARPPLAAAPAVPDWCWLLAYFAAHVLGRTLVSPALELDEAEQALWTQQLQWGYGAQPPLYTWLQWGVFQVLGVSVFSLALLKNALLASAYVSVWLAGRMLMPGALAAMAAASMLLLPQIGWEASRDLTHSVLLTTSSAATLAVVLALLRRPRPALYLLAGVLVGLGAMSKYSYAAFLAVLLLALLAGRDTRAVLLDRWAFAAAAVAGLLVLPHAWWLLQHWSLATGSTADKLAGAVPMGRLEGLWRGVWTLVLALLAFGGPWALVMALLFGRGAVRAWSRWWRPAAADGAGWNVQALWRRYFLALGLLCLALVVFGGVTRFKDRWMMPFLFLLPLAFFSCAPELARHPGLARLRRWLAVLAVAVLVLLTARVPWHALRERPDELNQPVRELAQALRARGYAGAGTILASDRTLAGALRLQFPKARIEVGDARTGLPSARPLVVVEQLEGLSAPAHDVALPYRYATRTAAPARYRYELHP